jgi:hypothetical protein
VSGGLPHYARSNVGQYRESGFAHHEGDVIMLSALLETVGALGVLASVVVKLAELRNEYRRRAAMGGEAKRARGPSF